jgi:flagellar hook assembly protein FlgD
MLDAMRCGSSGVRTRRWIGGVAIVAMLAMGVGVGATAPPAAAADLEVRIHPDSADQYVNPQGVTYVEFCVTEPAYVGVVVRDAQGVEVRTLREETFSDVGLCPASLGSGWDLRDASGEFVPAGVYTIEITARTEAGETAVASARRGVFQAPGPFLSFDLPEQPTNGPFELGVQFPAWFTEVVTVGRVTLRCTEWPGQPYIEIGGVDGISADGSAVIAADPLRCRTPTIFDSNPVRVHADWIDPLGFEHVNDPVGLVDIDFGETQSATFRIGLTQAFGPQTGDVVYSHSEQYVFHFEDVRVGFCLSRAGLVDAVVRDAAGQVVRTLVTDRAFAASACASIPPVTVLGWDQRDDAGEFVPDGDYTVELSATDASGQSSPPDTAELSLLWHVSGQEPGELVRPAPGDAVSGAEEYEFVRAEGFEPEFRITQISVGCTTSLDVVWDPAAPIVGTWNAAYCPDGDDVDVPIEVWFMDPFRSVGHMYRSSVPVDVHHEIVTPGVASVAEGDEGSATIEVPVTLSGPVDEPVWVYWQASDGTATPAVDFDGTSGRVDFAPGETEKTVSVTVHGDDAAEADELVFVRFSSITNARLGGLFGVGLGVIEDDDSGPRIRAGQVTVTEPAPGGTATAELTLTLSEPATDAVTVDWRTANNSALAGTDYVAATGTATFAPGETETTVPVEVLGDDAAEKDEVVVVALSNAQNASVGGWLPAGFVVIEDRGE